MITKFATKTNVISNFLLNELNISSTLKRIHNKLIKHLLRAMTSLFLLINHIQSIDVQSIQQQNFT